MRLKNYLRILNYKTLIALALSFGSCVTAKFLHWKLYLDFLIIGLVIAFPLTITIRESFRRRERAIQYLSTLKAAWNGILSGYRSQKWDSKTRQQAQFLLVRAWHHLQTCLEGGTSSERDVRTGFGQAQQFLQEKTREGKDFTGGAKWLGGFSKIHECVEYLLASRRQKTPFGLQAFLLLAIFLFVVFFPLSLFFKQGLDTPLWYAFINAGFKSFCLISLYNVNELLENPFDLRNPESIRLEQFDLPGSWYE